MHSFIILRRLIVVIIVIAIGFLSACKRLSPTDVGSGLIPSIDGIFTKDTVLEVITETFASTDTARINKGDKHLLGGITRDPLFGTSRASLFFEMKPASYPYYIPGHKDSLVVDSAVLILGYAGAYGDSLQALRLHVEEISQNTPLSIARNYPVNYPDVYRIHTSGQLAQPVTVDIRRLADSVNNRYEKARNQIRIRLNASVASRFLKGYDSTSAYRSDSAFRTYFAGFALTTDASAPANALLKINLLDTNTKFALYYSSSSTGATQRDTAVSYFRFDANNCAAANFVVRNRSGAEIASHLSTTINPKPDSLVYIQTSPGTFVRIKIPGLKKMGNGIIHRAELITEQVPDNANLLLEQQMNAPRYLLLSVFDSANNRIRSLPNDYIINSQSGPNIADFGGYHASKSVPGYDKISSYTFNISRYVQGIVTRKDTSFTLMLSAPAYDSLYYKNPYPDVSQPTVVYLSPSVGNDTGDGRVRLGGGSHSRFRMRLRIIFSRM